MTSRRRPSTRGNYIGRVHIPSILESVLISVGPVVYQPQRGWNPKTATRIRTERPWHLSSKKSFKGVVVR